MTQPDIHLLGRGPAEEERLKRQIADLAPVSDAQLVKIGIRPGERVVDLGCGPGGVLHLLGKHVGPSRKATELTPGGLLRVPTSELRASQGVLTADAEVSRGHIRPSRGPRPLPPPEGRPSRGKAA